MQATKIQGDLQTTASIFVVRDKTDKEICFVAGLIDSSAATVQAHAYM
jgi:hypothetical protein